MRRSLKKLWLLGALALTACATRPDVLVTAPQIAMPRAWKQPCPRPIRPDGHLTAGDLAAFSEAQEHALNACEAQRDAAVGVLEDMSHGLE